MKKFISVLALFLIAASFLPLAAANTTYLPLIVNYAAAPSPSPTEAPIPTPTPEPGAAPIITYFTAWFGYGNSINFSGTVKNVGTRPIDLVKIHITVYGWCFNGSTDAYIYNMIQPGASADFSGSTIGGNCNLTVTASIVSWREN